MNANTTDLKNYLHKLVVETEDESILLRVKDYFTFLKGENPDWWDIISDKEKEEINLGLQQLENAEGIPHEKVMRKVNELLGRK